MRILHLTKKYLNISAGDSYVVANLRAEQLKLGHQVDVLTSNCHEISGETYINKFGILDKPENLDTITMKRIISLCHLFLLSFIFLKNKKPSVIHSHSIDMAAAISIAARFYKIPIIHTFHTVNFNDPMQSKFKRNIELFLLKIAGPKRILILNPDDIKDFNKKGFRNVTYIPNGVNLDEWKLSKRTKKNRIFTFIAVGRLEEQKGFKYLIEAAKLLENKSSNFQVQIVGSGSQYDNLTKLIKKKNLEKKVFILGNKTHEELKLLYAKAHVFISTSLWEEFSLTLLEAWASNLPVIVTTVGNTKSVCENKRDSLVVRPKNSIYLYKTMYTVFQNRKQNIRMANYGFLKVSNNFTWKQINPYIIKQYHYDS